MTAAVALGSGTGANNGTTSTITSSATSTAAAAVPKVWLCHHTGSWKHPYHLIHISGHAVAAHRRHGDVNPGAGNSCPTTQPAGTKQHGKSGENHGNGGRAGKAQGKSASASNSADNKADADDNDADGTTVATPAHP
jgi:hypothetical protein